MDVGERKSQNSHNRPTAPDQLTNGAAEKVDLIAEWKIVTTQRHELLESVFHIA